MSSTTETEDHAIAQRYLTFRLSGVTYGVGILKVQEIIGLPPVTPVPRTPEFVRGVINLRGRIIPVVDLRRRFGMEVLPDTDRTCVVITQVDGARGTVIMGVVVEDVAEVVDIPYDVIVDPPEFGSGVDTEFLVGMGKIADRVVILLDIDRVLSGSDAAAVEHIAEGRPPEEPTRKERVESTAAGDSSQGITEEVG